MDGMAISLTEEVVQCWGCAVFDRLFQIISVTGSEIYSHFTHICVIIFALLFTIFTFNAILKNFQEGFKDPFMKESFLKVFVRAVFALTLLSAGTVVPKVISNVIFEPVAAVTLEYSQAMINTTEEVVEEKVSYTPTNMIHDGIYSQDLRDKIIMLMETTITQFQSYIKLGIAIMDYGFSWSAFLGISIFFKHLVLFFMGFYLAWGFVKLFFKYCCYFADVIIAMAFFAFFFPLSMVMAVFKDVKAAPKWFGNIGKTVGVAQLKNLINAIVTLGSVILTYTIIIVIIAKFFTAADTSVADLMTAITSGEVHEEDINADAVYSLTLASFVVLIYVLNFVFDQIPQITKMVLSTFGVQENSTHSEQFAKDMGELAQLAYGNAVKVGSIIVRKGEKKDDKENKEDKKDSKKENKSDEKKD